MLCKAVNQAMGNKKVAVCLLLFLAPLVALAQPDQIPVSQIKNFNNDQFKKYFNSDSVRVAFRWNPKLGMAEFDDTGLFIMYEKADTLNFNNPFFNADTPFNSIGNTSEDYILEGLVYYEKRGAIYQKLFANDNAFFCASCNNMSDFGIAISNDTATISLSWGPKQSRSDDFAFVYRPDNKRWQLVYTLSGGWDDMDHFDNTYVAYNTATPVFLDNEDAENLGYSPFTGLSGDTGVSHFISLGFTPGGYKGFLKDLKKIPVRNYYLIHNVFTAIDADQLTSDNKGNNNITSENVAAANNVGYFLEQANVLSPAQVILDSVIAKFSDREVAYLNLGDVYRKQGNIHRALDNYLIYTRLMKLEKLENKIPDRIKSFIKENER